MEGSSSGNSNSNSNNDASFGMNHSNSSGSLLASCNSGSFVMASCDKKPPIVPKHHHHGGKQQLSSIEEAAASLAASMGLVLDDDDTAYTVSTTSISAAANNNVPVRNSNTDITTTTATSSPKLQPQQHHYQANDITSNTINDKDDNNMSFVRVEFPRPLFFGCSIPYQIQRELEEIRKEVVQDKNHPKYIPWRAALNSVLFFQNMEYLYTYSPSWDNSWDRLYSKSRAWDHITKAQTAATSYSSNNIVATTTSDYNNATATTASLPTPSTPTTTTTTTSYYDNITASSSSSSLDVTIHTPLYGCDDTSLPTVADLGQFDTNQEQLANQHEREMQMQIDTVFPEVFRVTCVKCTNPATNQDDSTSWNNRSLMLESFNNNNNNNASRSNNTTTTTKHTSSPARSIHDTTTTTTTTTNNNFSLSTTPQQQATATAANVDTRNFARIGWWNNNRLVDENNSNNDTNNYKEPYPVLVHDYVTSSSSSLLPLEQSTSTTNITPSPLPPSIAQLGSHNLPLSLLHGSTGTSYQIPFLTDRPPSWRYLQIDTQAVGFGGSTLEQQLEPLFCTMAIYHVEPVAIQQQQHTNFHQDYYNNESDTTSTPKWRFSIPKSGRITEALRFDVVNDLDLEPNFRKSLWPYHANSSSSTTTTTTTDTTNNDHEEGKKDRLQGTRVGIFPLPSNLEIANLHAVLIVHKVLSEDPDQEPYIMKQQHYHPTSASTNSTASSTATNTNNQPLPLLSSADRLKLRSRAQKANNKLGLFLTPFAFGVAPLLKAIGEEVPTSVPTSRAVQIPLFKLDAGRGETPILEHIISLRYPTSTTTTTQSIDLSSSAINTNGGKAMLVMRNFGYLSLPCAIDTRSSLAKDRVVDFSCERQIRRREEDNNLEEREKNNNNNNEWNTKQALLPPWHDKYIAEPTKRGGRCRFWEQPAEQNEAKKKQLVDRSIHSQQQQQQQQTLPFMYAQELAPIPISMTTPYLNPNHMSHNINYLRATGGGGGAMMIKSANSPTHGKHLRTDSTESGMSLSSGMTSINTFGNSATSSSQSPHSADAEPMWNTSICNELLLHPRFVDNCSKSKQNLCISFELRKLAFIGGIEDGTSPMLLAIPLQQPHIHNPRRGPWLVHTAFSSCAYHVSNPLFIDEVKLKLPAVLDAEHVLYCCVYNISVKGKKTFSTMFSGYMGGGTNKDSKPPRVGSSSWTKQQQHTDNTAAFDEPDQFMMKSNITKASTSLDNSSLDSSSDGNNESNEFYQASAWLASPHVDLLGSGILPLTHLTSLRREVGNDSGTDQNMYLIANGLHDVNICYSPKALDQVSLPTMEGQSPSNFGALFGGGKQRPSSDNPGYSKNADKQQYGRPFHILPPSMVADDLTRYTLDEVTQLPEGTVVLRPKTNTVPSPSTAASDGAAGIVYLDNHLDTSPSGSWDHEEGSSARSILSHSLQLSKIASIQPRAYSRNHTSATPNQSGESRDGMILQLRSVSLSTLHQQNAFLAELLGQAPSPQVLTEIERSQLAEKISETERGSFLFDEREVLSSDDVEENSPQCAALISLLTDLTRPSLCPCIEHVLHFHGVTSQLLLYTISGPNGKYDASYCDPRSLTPLRLHAFSTLLNIWWQLVLFLQKCGVKQLDGRRKWNIYMLAKTVGLVWSENAKNIEVLEEYSPDMEEENVPHAAKVSQVESQSQVEILPVVQEESSSFLQAEASVTSDVAEADTSFSSLVDICEPPSLRKEVKRPLKLTKRQVTPFPTDSIFKLNPVIDDALFRKLLEGDSSVDNLDELIPRVTNNNAIELEPISKLESVIVPKRKHRHNRTVTPMGNLNELLQSAKEREGDDSELFIASLISKLDVSGDNMTTESSMSGPIFSSFGISTTNVPAKTSESTNILRDSFESESCIPSLSSGISRDSNLPLLQPLDGAKTNERVSTPKPLLDSKFDFQNLLKQASMSPIDNCDGCPDGIDDILTPKLSAAPSVSSLGRRKWMTLPPTSSLATIEEDMEGEDSKSPLFGFAARKKIVSDSSESLLAPSVKPSGAELPAVNDNVGELLFGLPVKSKQFRIPRKSGGSLPDASIKDNPRSLGLQDPSAYGMKLGDESGENSDAPVAPSLLGAAIETDKVKHGNQRGGQRRRPPRSSKDRSMTDDEIESAGTAFLDMIGKNLGLGVAAKDMGGEERLVGQNHHRKTLSRCSIDWTLPPPDLILQNRQRMDLHAHGQPQHDEDASGTTSSDEDEYNYHDFSLEGIAMTHSGVAATHQNVVQTGQHKISPHPLLVGEDENVSVELSPMQLGRGGPPSTSTEDGGGFSKNNDGNSSVYTTASTVIATNSFFKNAAIAASFPQAKYLKLPGYADRRKTSAVNLRWWPFAYEVILYTWVTLLLEQTKSNDASGGVTPITSGARKRVTGTRNSHALLASAPDAVPSTVPEVPQQIATATSKQLQKYLSEKASKAKGVTISCAPILFEVIKKSLAERIHNLLKQRQKLDTPVGLSEGIGSTLYTQASPNASSATLAMLDPSLLTTLETLVQLITDACIDSRNFDSNSFRQTSSDVNDSLVMFLRDLYSLLHPAHVHRLICVYFSRYIMKEGKHWSNRDSKIGLRCGWETCKFRLNAVTLLIRFPDFVKVNSPIFGQIDSGRHSRTFYSQLLEYIERDLSIMAPFAATESQPSVRKRPANTTVPSSSGVAGSIFVIPPYQPHCLAELVIDICLSASGHTEQLIQHRASSLLCELFWMHQLEGKANGTLSAIGGMYITLISKILDHLDHLACLPAKSQLRKDLLPAAVFVMQAAPSGLLSALWRKLIRRSVGKGSSTSNKNDIGGGVSRARSNSFDSHPLPPPIDASSLSGSSWDKTELTMDEDDKPCILDVFCLLNLSLKTFEYEGAEIDEEPSDQFAVWQKEFVQAEENFSTTASRKWHAHDGAVVAINTARCIVYETLYLLRPHSSDESGCFGSDSITHTPLHLSEVMPSASFSGSKRSNEKSLRKKRRHAKYGSLSDGSLVALNFSVNDTILFIRATSSVYLHALSLRVSDSVIVKTLTGAIELLKIFGVKLFLSAVGETLQHWMRVVLMCGGARRANVRIHALDFLAVLLRVTWDSHGSLSRIRVPIIATLTEAMERIVATAAACHYREQRKQGKLVEHLSNDAAEASLCPLWRTLDRLHHQSASQNAAFKDSLSRLAEMMKKLYRAYIAAHSLAVADRMRANASVNKKASTLMPNGDPIRNDKLNRVTASSAGFSRQFLGMLSSSVTCHLITNDEAIEEVFLAAANVFSPLELPSNRVGWLRRLSEFHKSRGKPAEEASCHLTIHVTLHQAARAHACLWYSVPFLPWTSDSTDGMNLNGEGAVGGSVHLGGDYDDLEDSTNEYDNEVKEEFRGIHHVEKTASFRRLFRRAANSVQFGRGDWETYGNRNTFYGVANLYEYESVSSVLSLRELEEEMIEEAETAGDLFLTAGIIQSSRLSWSVATQFYAENFNFARLAYCYRRLSTVVASQVPVVDTNTAHELSSPMGRFYKVYFHGSAPDELVGKEFVYRTSADEQLEAFGKHISNILESLLQEGTPIDLTLDDGRPEESGRKRPARVRVAPIRINGRNREMGPCQIKITPLRPILQGEWRLRGSAEWFFKQSEISRSLNAQTCAETRSVASFTGEEGSRQTAQSPHHRTGKRFTSDIDRLGCVPLSFTGCSIDHQSNAVVLDLGHSNLGTGKEVTGVDMFTFTRPVRKDKRGSREWFKNVGDLADKSLRVSQFQVENCFPCCVSRQAVVDRTKLVYYQSPLEAGIEAVCSWCSVLFRTAVSINGQAVLAGKPLDHIGPSAEKVLADCIFLCKVKELGVALLSTNTGYAAEFDDDESVQTGMMGGRHGRLTEEEVVKFQHTLARSIGIFLELLHLLIARNRDLLLVVVKSRKQEERQQKMSSAGSVSYPSSPGSVTRSTRHNHRKFSSGISLTADQYYDEGDHTDASSIGSGYKMNKNGNEKIDAAIAVQSELQRAFISQAKILYPIVSNVLYSETPRWLKACTQDGYFSSGAYRQARISMEEEIFFYDSPPSLQQEGRSTAGLEPVPSDSASVSLENPSAPMYDAPLRSYSPNESSAASKTSDVSRRRRSLRSPARSIASSKHHI